MVAAVGIAASQLIPRGGAVATTAPSSSIAATAASVPFGVVIQVPDEGRSHVADGSVINYKANPPVSGPHYPAPKPWGVYDTPIAPGYFVHNLEHGGVVVLYDCPSGCPATVSALQQALRTLPKNKYGEVKLLAAPYKGLPGGARVAFLAWDFQEFFKGDLNLDQLKAFYVAHADKPCPANGPFVGCSPEDVP